VAQTQQTMHEIERPTKGMQSHWLIRKYVEQADVAGTNKPSRVNKPQNTRSWISFREAPSSCPQ
jgi:hypothetical protein